MPLDRVKLCGRQIKNRTGDEPKYVAMDMANMLNVRLSNTGPLVNCNTCGNVMNSCEGSPCVTSNRISHDSCMVVVPVGNRLMLAEGVWRVTLNSDVNVIIHSL